MTINIAEIYLPIRVQVLTYTDNVCSIMAILFIMMVIFIIIVTDRSSTNTVTLRARLAFARNGRVSHRDIARDVYRCK
jgi:hypothetical protein